MSSGEMSMGCGEPSIVLGEAAMRCGEPSKGLCEALMGIGERAKELGKGPDVFRVKASGFGVTPIGCGMTGNLRR